MVPGGYGLKVCEFLSFSCCFYTMLDYHKLGHEKLAFCICENKGADKLHGNCEADLHFYYLNIDRTIPSTSYVKNFRPGLCLTWSETLKTRFLMTLA